MVTFAQAQERAEEWVNGDVPAYQHREVRVREFGLGFVVWAEDRPGVPVSGGGRQRLVIARDSGEVSLWPGLPVGEVIRRYEEEYGAAPVAGPEASVPPQRIDSEATSFMLSPPEWLQEAADRAGIPDNRAGAAGSSSAGSGGSPAEAGASAVPPVPSGSSGPYVPPVCPAPPAPEVPVVPPVPSAAPAAGDGAAGAGAAAAASGAEGAGAGPAGAPRAGGSLRLSSSGAGPAPDAPPAVPLPGTVVLGALGGPGGDAYEPTASEGVPADATPWAGTDVNQGSEDASVPLPATVFAPPLSGTDADDAPRSGAEPEAKTTLMAGGSQLPKTAVAPAIDAGAPRPQDIADAATSRAPVNPPAPQVPPGPPSAPAGPGAPGAPGTPGGEAHHAATMLAGPGVVPPPGPPAPPGAPGAGAPTPPGPPAPPGAPGAPGGDAHHAATMLAGPGVVPPPGPPAPPGAPGAPGGDAHHAATMLAGPGVVPPPGPPAAPGGDAHHAATMLAGPGVVPPPGPPAAPGAPGGPGTPPGGVHHAATMLAGPGVVPPPGQPGAPLGQPAAGQPPQAPPPAPGVPVVGPGYQAVLRYRAPDGSEQQLIRRSAPGTPHPEWQILHELRAMNVPPQQVLELHTELESCELPGGYCARMIRETWPQVRITSVAPYGKDHAGRQAGMHHLLTHQGELHQVADGPARPAPQRAPLPAGIQTLPAIPMEAIGQELAGVFGPQGVFRFEPAAVSRQGVPEVVAQTLVMAGLPVDFGPFFWAQAVPGQPVPTLAELAAQRGVPAASDAASYLVVGSDFGKALCVQYGTANIVAVPVEAGPGGAPVPPQFVNSSLPQFARSLAMLGHMWRLRMHLTPEQAGRWTVDFQAQLAALDGAALASPESWWSVLLEQMWDGLL
ncbi:SUKH-4 family immunity protein [Streptomyces sp. NPDC086023]|uniref:SUKH-4 family immunity protein n=1 Tax=Streptomyces sp. NPDC086023 TaxID=3365746 RepID=UPI0037D8D640